MSREKQIEEMAKVLCEDCARDVAPCRLNGTGRRCDAVMEQAEALYNAGYRKQSEWISVEERLPAEDVDVLAVCDYHEDEWRPQVCYRASWHEGRWQTSVGGEYVLVTHWMPLPEAPKMRKEDEKNG